jgi:hypothetical protein
MSDFNTSLSKLRSLVGALTQSHALLIAVSVLLFLVNLLGRFPGEPGPDEIDQYHQAVAYRFDDWHPPIMAWLWSYLRLLADGFGPMFTFQIVLYWFGFGIIAFALARAGRYFTSWGVLCVGVFPLFLMQNINLDKDVGMAATFLAAFGVVFWFRIKDAKISLLAGAIITVLLLYGTLVRTNAVFAAVPLLAYFLYRRSFAAPWRLLVVSVFIALLMIPASTAFNRKVLKAMATTQMAQLQLYDLVGTAYYSHDLSIFGPDDSLTDAEVQRCYSPILQDALIPWGGKWGNGKCSFFWDRLVTPHRLQGHNEFEPPYAYKTPIDGDALARLWLTAIAEHPIAYLQHRLAHFNSALFFWVPSHHADPRVTSALVYGKEINHSAPSTIKKMLDVLRYNVFTTPAFWLVVGACLFLMLSSVESPRDPWQREAALAVTTSALLYTIAYFIIGVATDPRYTLWSLIAVFVAVVVSFSNLTARFRSPGRLEWACVGMLILTIVLITIARLVGGDALYSA